MTQVVEFNPSVDVFIGSHSDIQAMPDSAVRIIRLTRDPNCNLNQLLHVIEQDTALAARIIKTVNSAFYSPAAKITRLDRAVAFMGLKAVKEVAIASSLSSMCKDVQIGSYSARSLWDHSVGVGILARELAILARICDPEDAFLNGMLHDVGLLLSAQSEVSKTERVFNAAASGRSPFTDVEQAEFGFDHCELGERLSQIWKFPEHVGAVIRWHHRPEDAPEEFKAACRIVYIADTLCSGVKVGFPLTAASQEVTDQMLSESQISREAAEKVAAKLPILLRLHLS
jgi:HD-like signal output (HDOD) protein